MFLQLFIGGVLIAITVLFQAIAFDLIINQSRRLQDHLRDSQKFWKAMFLAIVVLAVTVVLIIEIWFWAILYLILDAQPDLEHAIYFSTTCFSTVGFGDLVLPNQWRILSGVEATNGFLLFGWATAFIFEIVSKVYRREGRNLEP
ncbi:MAG: two pore domain potassium channel family protein [Hyphomicrobiales bacterium]|nr:two pore domain potassium channel family protein [Hyphomicrobiales bacterium]